MIETQLSFAFFKKVSSYVEENFPHLSFVSEHPDVLITSTRNADTGVTGGCDMTPNANAGCGPIRSIWMNGDGTYNWPNYGTRMYTQLGFEMGRDLYGLKWEGIYTQLGFEYDLSELQANVNKRVETGKLC